MLKDSIGKDSICKRLENRFCNGNVKNTKFEKFSNFFRKETQSSRKTLFQSEKFLFFKSEGSTILPKENYFRKSAQSRKTSRTCFGEILRKMVLLNRKPLKNQNLKKQFPKKMFSIRLHVALGFEHKRSMVYRRRYKLCTSQVPKPCELI